MALVYIDVYGRCDLPIDVCSEVVLCMIDGWEDKTEIGFKVAFGRIVARNKTWLTRTPSGAYQPCCTTPVPPSGCVPTPTTIPAGQCCPSTPAPTNYCCGTTPTSGYEYCIYQIEIDTTQFLIDPLTDTNYVPICSDFLDIMPYPCIMTQLFEGAGLNVVDSESIDLTYTPFPDNILTANLIVDPDVSNILSVGPDGVLALETPNAAVDTESIDITLSGTANRTIQADLILDPAGDNQAIVTADGLYVAPAAAETPNAAVDTNSVNITLSDALNRTIQADVILSANAEQAITEEVDGLLVEKSYADVESDAITGDAGALDISAANTYTIATSGIITVNNPSTSRDLAFKLDGDTNVQCILQTSGVWKFIIEQDINGAGFSTYAEKQYGTFPGAMGYPFDISAGYETTIPAGGSLTVQRRIKIQTVTPSAAGSTAGVYSSDMRAIWVTK